MDTDRIIHQQDFVDNTIHDAICNVAGGDVPWDIDVVGAVRDVIINWLEIQGIAHGTDIYPSVEE